MAIDLLNLQPTTISRDLKGKYVDKALLSDSSELKAARGDSNGFSAQDIGE